MKSSNYLPTTNRRPAAAVGTAQHVWGLICAQASVASGGRSAKRWPEAVA